jgi:hypothetical protein
MLITLIIRFLTLKELITCLVTKPCSKNYGGFVNGLGM